MTNQPGIAVSTVIFALREGEGNKGLPALWLPLVRRTREPYLGDWALPGGPLSLEESLADAARRHLASTAGLTPRYLEQLYAFGDLARSGAERVVSIVYWALVGSAEASAAQEGNNVCWFSADELPTLAFDHQRIVDYALWRLRNKVAYAQIAHRLLGETFTLAQLRTVYEAILQRPLDPANFRRYVLARKQLEDTGAVLEGVPNRPPRLYRYVDASREQQPF
ncbi:NUDIX hydrolase [Carnimonas bestiolae]|uniref:NUDIX hydrolase n=1 Tax=Carnimonas bestiolae TaxID=3402172 RepID=UPI003EDC9A3A